MSMLLKQGTASRLYANCAKEIGIAKHQKSCGWRSSMLSTHLRFKRDKNTGSINTNERLSIIRDRGDLTGRLKTAMRIHADADRQFLSEQDLLIDQETTRLFVEQLLAVAGELNNH